MVQNFKNINFWPMFCFFLKVRRRPRWWFAKKKNAFRQKNLDLGIELLYGRVREWPLKNPAKRSPWTLFLVFAYLQNPLIHRDFPHPPKESKMVRISRYVCHSQGWKSGYKVILWGGGVNVGVWRDYVNTQKSKTAFRVNVLQDF